VFFRYIVHNYAKKISTVDSTQEKIQQNLIIARDIVPLILLGVSCIFLGISYRQRSAVPLGLLSGVCLFLWGGGGEGVLFVLGLALRIPVCLHSLHVASKIPMYRPVK
jgi:hypothetical protein